MNKPAQHHKATTTTSPSISPPTKAQQQKTSQPDENMFPTEHTPKSNPGPGSEVVKPYAIEEPGDEDEPTFSHQRPALMGRLPGIWQGDLVDSMEDLHCDSDNGHLRYRPTNKRGKKRKPTRSARKTSYGADLDIEDDGQNASPKKLRRRTRMSDLDMDQTTSPPSSYETGSSEAMSARSPSSDSSSLTGSNESPTPDQMDID